MWLLHLHRMVTDDNPTSVPVERYITQLLDEVPFPSPRTLLQLNASNQNLRVIFTQPEDLPLPRSATTAPKHEAFAKKSGKVPEEQYRNAPVNTADASNPDDIEAEFQRRRKEQAEELEIQEAFLKFMVHILKGYKSYLRPITKAPTVGTTDPDALFHLTEFLKSRDKSNAKFFNLLMKTQMFIRFIEERSFVVDHADQSLTFFDDCAERLQSDESEIRLLELEGVHKNDRTVFVLPPEPANYSDSYAYAQFILNPVLLLSGKRRNRLASLYQTGIPSSPMARRTTHEIKSAQKLARKYQRMPDTWAKCLCGTCHTLYFMTLPSMLSLNVGKENKILQHAYELLVRATYLKLPCDEVCYRLMMQLCGEHNRPLLAVKLLVLMKKFGIQPNALTYGLYNRCVLEAQWPAHAGSSQVLWNKLRNVVFGAAHFKFAAKRKAQRNYLSASTEGGSSLLDPADRSASRTSLDSHEGNPTEGSLLDKFRRVANSIVKGSVKELVETEETDGAAADASEENLEQSLFVQNSPSECRLLSRSESGGDANLIDKLQSTTKKTCSRNLQFDPNLTEDAIVENDKNSPTKVSPRELITENDPLGACLPSEPPPEQSQAKENDSVPETPANPVLTDEPVLFRNSVQRSATFEGSPPSQNKLHRSETVPAATVASSLASLGSSFKLTFSRYATQRISLRKANLKVPQQFIENAIINLSPSSLTGKKSNELIQGSLSTIKSAANTMVKKMEEIKEAISTSATSTPVKALTAGDRMASGDALNDVDGDSAQGSEEGERVRKVSMEMGSYRGSCANLKDYEEPLPESLYPTPEEAKAESDVDITLTTCSQCHNCNRLLYDEDIMANWSAEDSNLNTLCQACGKPTVPLLTVTISGREIRNCDPFSVPYLNPLVLRKELENILAREGDLSVADSKFVDEHPIIYWNLIWTFERINIQTHLPNLYFKHRVDVQASSSSKANGKADLKEEEEDDEDDRQDGGSMQLVEEGTDPLTQELAVIERLSARVRVKCVWDEPKFHSEGPPMYILWRLRDSNQIISMDRSRVTKSFMQQIINYIRVSDLAEPIKSLTNEREHLSKKIAYSIYRDILFLACKVLGRAQIDINAFDKEYTMAYSRYCERAALEVQDKPISLSALYCRQYFRPLLLP